MSSVNSASSSASNMLRITGMASGLDTDSIVKQLMQSEKIPLDKLKQKEQLAEWRRDAYRDITSTLKTFQDTYMDTLKSATNILSSSYYKKIKATSTDDGIVTASGGSSAAVGSHKINVSQLATAATDASMGKITKNLQGGLSVDQISYAALKGKSFTLTVDGTSKTITFGDDVTDTDSLMRALQNGIDNAFGSGKITVSKTTVNTASDPDHDNTGSLMLVANQDTNGHDIVNKISVSSVSNASKDAYSLLGFGFDGANNSNRINTGDTLETLAQKMQTSFAFDESGKVNLTINGEKFSFDKSITLSNMMSQINSNSNAGVNMQYDEVTDAVAFTAKQTGAGKGVNLSETDSSFLSSVKVQDAATVVGSGSITKKDYSTDTGMPASFSVTIDGVKKDIVLNDNFEAFTENDMNLYLKEKIETAFSGKTVSVTQTDGKLKIQLTGGGNSIEVGAPSSGTSALSDLGLDGPVNANYTAGQDAKVTLDGQSLVRSNNTFTVSGITYTLQGESTDTSDETISMSLDTDAVYSNISQFVEQYNKMLDTLNSKLSETYDRDYPPLTDDQKDAMSDDEITKWETQAKAGLLQNDSIVQSIVNNMREAMSTSVQGIATSLTAIGITTGTYEQKGKLIIDETKLKAAIQNDPDGVMNLFSKQSASYGSSSSYRTMTSSQKNVRYKEEGLAYRLSDIINDNISTFRDSNNKKGVLLETAGLIGDSSEFKNIYYDEIEDYQDQIDELTDKLNDKETAYYNKYAALESAMEKLNSQASWLTQQLGSK